MSKPSIPEYHIQLARDVISLIKTKEDYEEFRLAYYPHGSGPLSLCAMICAFLDILAEQNGWKPKD